MRRNMKRILLVLLVLGLLLPVAVYCAPEGVSFHSGAFAEEDLQREQALTAALKRTEGSSLSRFFHASMPEKEDREGRYIVRFSQTISEEELLAHLSGTSYRLLADSSERVFLVKLTDPEAFRDSCGEALLYCSEDRVLQTAEIPSDPAIAERTEYAQLDLFSAWERVTPSPDIIIAVLDTGIDRAHEEFADAAILDGYDVITESAGVADDRDGHGTAVTGLIAAAANNGVGSAGVAYGVRIMPVRVANGSTDIYSSDLISGIRFAADAGARILNLSLGGYTYSAAEYDAVRYANERGCILIAAAGNDGGTSNGGDKIYPASYPGVISVGSCDATGARSSFSQQNAEVDVLAPGENLLLLVSGKKGEAAYRMGSGTSYSAALVTGVAALALSALDDGIRMNGEELLVLLADGRIRRDGSGYGAISASQAVEDANIPLITGVENGKTYSGRVTIHFNRGTATLDGEEFFDGNAVFRSGGHTLTVTDGENRQTVSFRILYTPATFEMTEGEKAVSFTYAGGTATVDGFPYQSGEPITAPGWHVFRLTNAVGDVTERAFFCDYRLPVVSGVEDGGVYDHPVRIRIAGSGQARLDGEEIGTEATVFTDGQHTLTVSNAGESRTWRFTLATGVKTYENTVARSGIICDESHGWYAVYSEMLIGLRVYDLETGAYRAFLDTESVEGYAFVGDRLLIFGDWCLTVLDPAQMLEGDPLLASYPVICDGFACVDGQLYCLAEGALYTISPEEGGWEAPSQELAFDLLLETDADELYTDGTALWLYSNASDRFDRMDTEGTTSFPMPFSAVGTRKYFSDGWLFCGEYALRLSDFSIAFSYEGYAVGCTDMLLFTTDAVYRLADGVRVGNYETMVSCVLPVGETVFVCGAAGGILRYPVSFGYGYAPEADHLFADTGVNNVYTSFSRLYGNAAVTDSAAIGDRFCAVFGAERKLLLFRGGTLEREVDLPFAPAGVCLTESRCAVWSADGALVWLDGALLQTNVPAQNAFFLGSTLYLFGSGRLYRYEADAWVDTGVTGTAATGAGDVLAWLSGGQLYVRSGARTVQVASAASSLYTDGTYVAADRTVYRASSLAVSARLDADVLDICARVVLTTGGLYDINTNAYLSKLELGTLSAGSACLGTGCGLILFSTGSFSVSRYAYPIWETPVLSGVATDARYEAQTTIRYDRGQGYLDGTPCPSGTRVTNAGAHVFTLVLPCSIVRSYAFTIIPGLESISFSTTNYRVAVGGTGTLRIRYFPQDATIVPVTFSVEGDSIRLESDGRFTALREGVSTVTARTADGRFSATCYVHVQAELLRFTEESGYIVDRDTGFLLGVPAGTSAAELMAHVLTDGEVQISTETVGTGTEILLLSAIGEEQDRLTVVIKGDLDGDGFITLQDLLLLEEALASGGTSDDLLRVAADLNGSGLVTDQDANLLERMLLRREESVKRGTPPSGKTGTVGLFLPSTVYRSGTLSVTLYLKDSTRASCAGCTGASGRLVYDTSALTYLGAESYGWDVSLYESGGEVSFLASGERSLGTLPIVTLRFSVSAEASDEQTIYLYDGVVLCKNSAYGIEREETVFLPVERVYGDVNLQISGMADSFAPERTHYEVRLPAGTPALDYTMQYPLGTTVTVRNTIFDRTDELDAVFTFRLPGGEKRTYTVHASRDGSPLPGSDSRLASLTVEGIAFPFTPAATFYRLTVPYDMKHLILHWETMDDEAAAVCTDPLLLLDQETDVTITVMAADGSQTIYTLRVYRAPKEDPSDSSSDTSSVSESQTQQKGPENGTPIWSWLLLGTVLVLLVGGAVLFLIRTRQNNPS